MCGQILNLLLVSRYSLETQGYSSLLLSIVQFPIDVHRRLNLDKETEFIN